jgi:AraC family transcriptional regulator, alkane utilization regulator
MDPLSLIIDDMRFDGVVFVSTELSAPWGVRLHTPGLAAFHVITQGQGWLLRDGHEPLRLQTGDLIVLPAGEAHTVQDVPLPACPSPFDLTPHFSQRDLTPHDVGGGGPRASMVSGHARFDVHMAAPLVQALPPLMHIRGMGEAPPPWLAIGLQFLAQELAAPRPGQQAIINRLGDILFMECLRDHVASLPERSGNWLSALKDRALSAALSCMHRQPAQNWTVPELAQQACLSRSAFADRFTQTLGEPPLTYLTRHRMRLAARQLAATNAPVSRVADAVGYASEAAFSQAFKREYGLSPSGWRQAAQPLANQ